MRILLNTGIYSSSHVRSHWNLERIYSMTHVLYTDIVLNTLNPDRAVEIITPGICGCQWISLTSVWPWCRNRSWGGRSFTPSTRAAASHDSTDRSHWLTTSSAPEAANTLESAGLHSTEVTGALCCLKFATGRPLCRTNQASGVRTHAYLFNGVLLLPYFYLFLSLICACTLWVLYK